MTEYEKLSLKLQLFQVTLLSILVEAMPGTGVNDECLKIVTRLSAQVREAVGE